MVLLKRYSNKMMEDLKMIKKKCKLSNKSYDHLQLSKIDGKHWINYGDYASIANRLMCSDFNLKVAKQTIIRLSKRWI